MEKKELKKELEDTLRFCLDNCYIKEVTRKVLSVLKKLNVTADDIEDMFADEPYFNFLSYGYFIPWCNYKLLLVKLTFEASFKFDGDILFRINPDCSVDYVVESYDYS